MRYLVPITFFLICIIGCKSQEKTKKIFLDFRLGQSEADTYKLIDKYEQSGPLKMYKHPHSPNEGVIYYTHTTPRGKKYYSAFNFWKHESDSLIDRFVLLYSDVLHENFISAYKGLWGGERTMTPVANPSIISDADIANDVRQNVASSYGKFDTIDSMYLDNGAKQVKYSWINKDGINITLTHISNKLDLVSGASYLYYFIAVYYELTDEMKRKLFPVKKLY